MTYDSRMLTVIETPMFIRYAAKVWDDTERDEFIAWLAEHPDCRDVICAAWRNFMRSNTWLNRKWLKSLG
jgi:hypothetical protein